MDVAETSYGLREVVVPSSPIVYNLRSRNAKSARNHRRIDQVV